jgi:hypothetical protein
MKHCKAPIHVLNSLDRYAEIIKREALSHYLSEKPTLDTGDLEGDSIQAAALILCLLLRRIEERRRDIALIDPEGE